MPRPGSALIEAQRLRLRGPRDLACRAAARRHAERERVRPMSLQPAGGGAAHSAQSRYVLPSFVERRPTGSSMTGRGRSSSCSGGWSPFFGWFRRLLGRRVCGVAVKAERPQAEPRTYGLEGGVVHAMLVEPGRRNIRTSKTGGRVHHGRARGRTGRGVRLSVIHSPRDRCSGDPCSRSGAWCCATGWGGVNQALGSPPAVGSQTPQRPRAPLLPKIMPPAVPCGCGGWRARMWPSRRP